jgi:hypothetical protein
MSFSIDPEYGYVILVTVAWYLMQQLLLVIPVVQQRKATKIVAPTLYPRDSEIASLKLSPSAVKVGN